MMTRSIVTCDRCNQTIDGWVEYVTTEDVPFIMTAGYFIVTKGTWEEFARENESIVCNACMLADEKHDAASKAGIPVDSIHFKY